MKKALFFISWIFLCLRVTAQQKQWVVAQDGTGDFRTVQAAFDKIPLHNTNPVTIYIRNGVYREKLQLDSTKDDVTLLGEDRFHTILTYDDHPGMQAPNGEAINTRNSYSVRIRGNDFTARNITFRNTAGFTAGQAVALEVQGDRAQFAECRIVGNQDILFLNSDRSRQYYWHCYIEGTTDFIFGSATAWFEQCHIHSKKNSHVTAASTPETHPFGFVFYDCTLTGDTAIHNASLGRPWRPWASVTYLHCYIDRHIRPEGWSTWNNTDSYKMTRFAEYHDYGPGADTTARLSWTRQLSDRQAQQYTLKTVFGDWQPATFYPSLIVVSQDGNGDYRTIGEAINAVRDLSQTQVKILIRKGVYHEKIVIPSWKTNILLLGEDKDSTIITNGDYTGKPYPGGRDLSGKDKFYTYISYTLLIRGNDCSLEDLTVENTAGRVGQAVALHVEGDRCVIRDCRLLGNQDTLYAATENSRQYYAGCYIEGTTDFIFGEATAVFNHCTIRSLTDSYITAAATTPRQSFGFVFFDCRLIADTATVKKVYLGRPWRPHARTVFIRTEMGAQILPAGWDNWRNAENERTAYYAEFGSTGPGGNSTGRVPWSKQLTSKEAKDYHIEKILAGCDGWQPAL